MTALQLRIIRRAIQNRMRDGEDFGAIIKSYPKLSESEIKQIKNELGIENKNDTNSSSITQDTEIVE